MTNHSYSVLRHCWLGHQTCKNHQPYNLYCVGADVIPCSINQSINQLVMLCYCWLIGNDVCLAENPFVSGTHCFIEKDVETGIVWLHDTRWGYVSYFLLVLLFIYQVIIVEFKMIAMSCVQLERQYYHYDELLLIGGLFSVTCTTMSQWYFSSENLF